MDITTIKGKKVNVQLWLKNGTKEHLFACVSRQHPFVPLNLQFTNHEELQCFSKGSGTVYLSGYIASPTSYHPESDDSIEVSQTTHEENGKNHDEKENNEDLCKIIS